MSTMVSWPMMRPGTVGRPTLSSVSGSSMRLWPFQSSGERAAVCKPVQRRTAADGQQDGQSKRCRNS